VRRLLRADGTAWVVLSALLCVAAIVVTAICASAGAPSLMATTTAQALDWQPALGLREPWRLWTCAWVHGSAAHLAVNVAGGAVVAFVGWRARLPAAAALAWLVAWPGTQLAMAAIDHETLAAAMPHYFGLSGVLHTGVVVLGLSLACGPARRNAPAAPHDADTSDVSIRERRIGIAILVGTLAKVALEAPWNLAPHASEALGIAVAPVAHACGVVAGLMAWSAVTLLDRRAR
jgi:hypothetical protein